MTRKHFAAIAYALREAYAIGTADVDIASDAYHYRTRQFETDVLEVAAALSRTAGNDLNGNRRFKTHLFLQAAGYERRPDGSQYPTAVIR